MVPVVGKLAVELWLKIFQLTEREDLCALSVTCAYFAEIAQALLWRNVEIRYSTTGIKLCLALHTKPSLGRHVRVALLIYPFEEPPNPLPSKARNLYLEPRDPGVIRRSLLSSFHGWLGTSLNLVSYAPISLVHDEAQGAQHVRPAEGKGLAECMRLFTFALGCMTNLEKLAIHCDPPSPPSLNHFNTTTTHPQLGPNHKDSKHLTAWPDVSGAMMGLQVLCSDLEGVLHVVPKRWLKQLLLCGWLERAQEEVLWRSLALSRCALEKFEVYVEEPGEKLLRDMSRSLVALKQLTMYVLFGAPDGAVRFFDSHLYRLAAFHGLEMLTIYLCWNPAPSNVPSPAHLVQLAEHAPGLQNFIFGSVNEDNIEERFQWRRMRPPYSREMGPIWSDAVALPHSDLIRDRMTRPDRVGLVIIENHISRSAKK